MDSNSGSSSRDSCQSPGLLLEGPWSPSTWQLAPSKMWISDTTPPDQPPSGTSLPSASSSSSLDCPSSSPSQRFPACKMALRHRLFQEGFLAPPFCLLPPTLSTTPVPRLRGCSFVLSLAVISCGHWSRAVSLSLFLLWLLGCSEARVRLCGIHVAAPSYLPLAVAHFLRPTCFPSHCFIFSLYPFV